MQVVIRSLLALVITAGVAACSMNEHGLGPVDASHPGAGASGHLSGTAGAGGTDATTGAAGTDPEPTGGLAGDTGGAAGDSAGQAGTAAGEAGTSGMGGGTAGNAGTAGDTTGASGATGGGDGGAGSSTAGASGGSTAGAGGASAGAGGGSTAGAGGASAGGASGSGAAGTTATAPQPGCSDGTREGYVDMKAFPNIAACAGGWDTPGLTSTDARTPQCDRRAGNDGDKADGRGCSVADLCASGWHLCDSARAVSTATANAGCAAAVAPFADKPVFFVTRQRATSSTCDSTNQSGSNNLYGCGTIGSTADHSCAPFTRMLRDTDCQWPWACSNGPPGTATDELYTVTKQSSSRGGALCCKD